jgi:hypothetical protein
MWLDNITHLAEENLLSLLQQQQPLVPEPAGPAD